MQTFLLVLLNLQNVRNVAKLVTINKSATPNRKFLNVEIENNAQHESSEGETFSLSSARVPRVELQINGTATTCIA